MHDAEFARLAALGYNRIPLVLETFADLETPLSIYLKLAAGPYSYLLESVQGGERFARYSFIGLPASSRLVVRGHDVQVLHGENVTERATVEDPLGFVRDYLARFSVAPVPHLPRFCGGLVGYIGYEAVKWVERKLAARPTKPDPIDAPDAVLLLSEEVAIVDNLAGTLTLVVFVDPRNPMALRHGRERLEHLRDRLRRPLEAPAHLAVADAEAVSNTSRDAYLHAVDVAKRYIVDGDAMQVQVSQRFSRPFAAEPLALYRCLRTLNPSPYMMYFDLRDLHIVSASPEILVRKEGDRITVRPIAGTRRRGTTADEDAALAADLLADPKERAEHVMLIDLGRNDVGRIAETGSVRVTEQMVIERYSHVMHSVSNVDGRLPAARDAVDVLRATFPAGTVTGAPKVRAMEIIDELEPVARGVYAGAAGYLGFHGDMDMAIAIRTGVVKDGVLHVQAAAGVVADSVPEREWEETNIKARALLRAAEMASRGLEARREA
ncbi:MAG: anthranilate synthase component I [Gemmatimonadaceae bacterium]|nr:anthranilate synthase component I [Gemmatimonadaceae bacterium]